MRLGLIALLLAALSLTGCDTTDTNSGDGGAKKVTYKVTGTQKASITYTDGGTKTSQDTEAKIPWSKTVKAADDAIVYQVQAQNSAPGSKSVKCSISIDGKVVDRNEGKGQFAIASCEYNPNK